MSLKTIKELTSGDTTTTDVRGSSRTAYALEPTNWLRDIVDAAQKVHYFKQFSYMTKVPKGNKDVIVPYRSSYLNTVRTGLTTGDWASNASEGTDITFTKLNNLDGVQISPTAHNAGVSISNWALQSNAIDLIRAAKAELTYHAGDKLDQDLAYTISTATAATSTARGAQTVYGGDARAESELASGDTLTPNKVADAKTKLMSSTCKYWTPSSPAAEAISSQKKNPWSNVPNDPFVLFIAPEQENALLKDSQFVNASEYGSNEVVMNGEIGKYLGIKVVVTDNVQSFEASGTALDGGDAPSVNGHRCILCKPKAAYAYAEAISPRILVEDYPRQLSKDVILEMAYGVSVLHDDAIVFIDVADD
ncbi:MAG: N4-gp56 family major capsid protein [Sphaerochaetaceae bacterium]|nr:N4-gp56 family major capsid protein [Sphaerochaetaceae bacterium]